MSKTDDFRRSSLGNIAESMGAGRAGSATIPGEFRPSIAPVSAKLQGVKRRPDVSDIPVSKIGRDDDQPRKHFDRAALERLAESLKGRGQLQPIRVRWVEARGEYVVVLGERRWQAAQIAGLPTLACVVVEGEIPPAELLAIQVIENALREDLSPIEQARAFESMMRDHGWSQVDLARELNITQGSIAKALANLTLPVEVQEKVESGQLDQSKAYEISKAEPSEQAALADRVVSEGLTRDETAAAVRATKPKAGKAGKAAAGKGRGGKPKPAKLPDRRAFKAPNGLKVEVTGRKGFDASAWLAALEAAAEAARVEVAAISATNSTAAA